MLLRPRQCEKVNGTNPGTGRVWAVPAHKLIVTPELVVLQSEANCKHTSLIF